MFSVSGLFGIFKNLMPILILGVVVASIYFYFKSQTDLIQSMTTQISTLTQRIEILNADKARLEISNKALEKQIQSMRVEYDKYIQDLIQANKELASGELAIEDLKKRLGDSEAQIERIRSSERGSELLLNQINKAQDCGLATLDQQGECINGKFVPAK